MSNQHPSPVAHHLEEVMLWLPQSPARRLLLALSLVLLPASGLLVTTAVCARRKTVARGNDAPAFRNEAATTLAPQRQPRKRHEEEEDLVFVSSRQHDQEKTEPKKIAFPANDFAQATCWLNAQPEKKLPGTLKQQEVSWRVQVKEVSDWGVSFCLENGVGLATTRSGFYARVNRYTTTFRGDANLKSLRPGDTVRVTGRLVEIVGTFGMTPGYFFVLENWSIGRDEAMPLR